MSYRVCKDEGETITLPTGTRVFANPGAALKNANKTLKGLGVLYACDTAYTHRWNGNTLTSKEVTFTRVS